MNKIIEYYAIVAAMIDYTGVIHEKISLMWLPLLCLIVVIWGLIEYFFSEKKEEGNVIFYTIMAIATFIMYFLSQSEIEHEFRKKHKQIELADKIRARKIVRDSDKESEDISSNSVQDEYDDDISSDKFTGTWKVVEFRLGGNNMIERYSIKTSQMYFNTDGTLNWNMERLSFSLGNGLADENETLSGNWILKDNTIIKFRVLSETPFLDVEYTFIGNHLMLQSDEDGFFLELVKVRDE